jgi:NAD(P)-dependent dehydrogenase (short-subunit alcohol dehydrogenase family)
MINAQLKNILILGGSGNTGKQVAGFLLQETGCNLVLAGRKLARVYFPGCRLMAR